MNKNLERLKLKKHELIVTKRTYWKFLKNYVLKIISAWKKNH